MKDGALQGYDSDTLNAALQAIVDGDLYDRTPTTPLRQVLVAAYGPAGLEMLDEPLVHRLGLHIGLELGRQLLMCESYNS